MLGRAGTEGGSDDENSGEVGAKSAPKSATAEMMRGSVVALNAPDGERKRGQSRAQVVGNLDEAHRDEWKHGGGWRGEIEPTDNPK